MRCLSWAPGYLPGPLPGTVASLLGATLRLPVLTTSQLQGLGLPDPGALGGWGPSYLSHAGPQPGEGGHRAPRAPREQLRREAIVGRWWAGPRSHPPLLLLLLGPCLCERPPWAHPSPPPGARAQPWCHVNTLLPASPEQWPRGWPASFPKQSPLPLLRPRVCPSVRRPSALSGPHVSLHLDL